APGAARSSGRSWSCATGIRAMPWCASSRSTASGWRPRTSSPASSSSRTSCRRPPAARSSAPSCAPPGRGEPMRRSPYAAFAGIFVVTLLSLMAVGAVLPVLPRYVKGPLDSGNVAVGVAVGAFAFTGLGARPLAGRFADHRGRRPTVVIGSLLAALAGLLYLVPAGLPGLLAARPVLGLGGGS